MILGFTGTQRGMTPDQMTTVKYLAGSLPMHVLHHGTCIGSDAQAHNIALYFNARIVGHPPTDWSKVAVLVGYDELRPPYAYLVRNQHIVDEAIDGLIATPAQSYEVLQSGTWATVRRARKATRTLWIVLPDGSVME